MDVVVLKKKIESLMNSLEKTYIQIGNEKQKRIILQTVTSSRQDLSCGEILLAFERICDDLYEFDFILSYEMYKQIEQIGSFWKEIDESLWTCLQELIIDT